MDIIIRTEKTYCIEVTEHQARDLLKIAVTVDSRINEPGGPFDGTEMETLNALRQALLQAGLKKDPD